MEKISCNAKRLFSSASINTSYMLGLKQLVKTGRVSVVSQPEGERRSTKRWQNRGVSRRVGDEEKESCSGRRKVMREVLLRSSRV